MFLYTYNQTISVIINSNSSSYPFHDDNDNDDGLLLWKNNSCNKTEGNEERKKRRKEKKNDYKSTMSTYCMGLGILIRSHNRIISAYNNSLFWEKLFRRVYYWKLNQIKKNYK